MNTIRPFAFVSILVGVLVLSACSKSADPASAPVATAAPVTAAAQNARSDAGIAWQRAGTDAEVDAAFAAARTQSKPVFVYWGAKWCPPCNQLQATLFNRQDFIERTRAFLPVYVDGDSPGAQKIGARFRVSGYPTMVLFNPQGEEVTRLPGEVDPVRYTQVMTLGMNAARPVKAVLADALAGTGSLGVNDWRLLAFYSWDTDHQQIVAKDRLPDTLAALAAACPADQLEAATRLRLKALVAAQTKGAAAGGKTPVAAPVASDAILAVLADPARSREQTDTLTNYAAEVVRASSAAKTPQRQALLAAFDQALKRLQADATLSRADRMQALIAQVDLARIDEAREPAGAAARSATAPQLDAALLADVRAHVARADTEITDGYERQAVITAGAYLLEHAGLGAESDTLLKANLAKSHSPYYLMSALAGNAKKRGDKAEALQWYGQAFEKSEGPATRLQWGASYVAALVDLAPTDEATIERTTAQLFDEAGKQSDAFHERSGRSLARIGSKLQAWNKGGTHTAVMERLQSRLDAVCAAPGLGATERAACNGLLRASQKSSA